jgi:hypothetical protein
MEKATKSELGEHAKSKARWEPMTLAYAGDVKDLVRGGGKTGPNDDSDPANTSKPGGG